MGRQGCDRGAFGRQRGAADGSKPEARRHPVLKHFENNEPAGGRDLMRLIMVAAFVRVSMAMSMAMMLATAEQPCARDIYHQTETGNRDRFSKMNGNGIEDPADGFIADQQRDHGQDDGAREPGEIAELTRAQTETSIF